MKYFVIIASFCLFSCWGKDFQVIESTSQKWYGGTPGSGKGKNYVLKAVAYKSSDNLAINKIWIDGEFFEITPLTDRKDKNSTNFEPKDTLLIRVHQYTRTNMLGEVVKTEAKEGEEVPQEFEGAALIGYTYKGKQKYKVIEKFKELKLIAYP